MSENICTDDRMEDRLMNYLLAGELFTENKS